MKKVGSIPLMDSIWHIIGLVTCFSVSTSLAANNKLQTPPNVTCACPNEVLTFTCTTVGSGATIWGGSAFQCSTGEIILRHNAFDGDSPQSGDCESIIGESVGVQDNCYTSRLCVPISAEVNNRTVHCLYNSNTTTLIDEAQISVITGPYQQAPTRVRIIQVNTRELNVSWTPLDTNCPSIDYSINYPCGTCSVTTETTAICSDLQLPSNCTLSIHSVICGQVGTASRPIRVILRVPDKPVVDIIPIYSANSHTLIGFRPTIDQEASFNIADGISGSITSYSITYSQDTTEHFSRNSSCVEGPCEYTVYVTTPVCSSPSDTTSLNVHVSLSASNILGRGPPSNSTVIGCKNKFVQVEYDSTISAIVCRFLDQMDTSVKSCTVIYGQCGEVLAYTSQGRSTVETPNHIALSVDPGRLGCYVVTASSDTVTVIVEDTERAARRNHTAAIVASVVVISFIVIIAVILAIVLLVVVIFKQRRKCSRLQLNKADHSNRHAMVPVDTEKQNIMTELKLQHVVDKTAYAVFTVTKDCELRKLIKIETGHEIKRGRAFYEFEHDFERISDDKTLIFMDKDKELFYPGIDIKGLRNHQLVGDMVNRPQYKAFTVFVQSTGLGARHLKGGTRVLYQRQDHSWQKKFRTQLHPIVSNHFIRTTIQSDTTIKAFREMNKLPARRCNVFLELKNVALKKDKDLVDVILVDTKNTEELSLYSGPFARDIIKQTPDPGKWRVFVLCKFNESMELRVGDEVLHQNPNYTSGEFYELTVDEDDIRLSTFIKKKGYRFINGHAFYEFSDNEDLQCYKEVVHVYQKKNEKEKKFQSSTDQFYAIKGAPGMDIKPLTVRGYKIFLQSTSQGSRCLKKGTTLLYKKVQQSFIYQVYDSVYRMVYD